MNMKESMQQHLKILLKKIKDELDEIVTYEDYGDIRGQCRNAYFNIEKHFKEELGLAVKEK